MGVALIGTFDTVKPTQAAVGSLEQLLAWKLDLAHSRPVRDGPTWSARSAKFRAGQIVSLPVIAGHRDANYTDCPGNQLYDLLPRIRQAVAAIGQPKIYDPSLSTATFDPKGAPAVSSVTVEATVSQVASLAGHGAQHRRPGAALLQRQRHTGVGKLGRTRYLRCGPAPMAPTACWSRRPTS